ncbi:hypothetical protein D210916BOD24_24140 [Alteromonas sp. D210916BOD_24]
MKKSMVISTVVGVVGLMGCQHLPNQTVIAPQVISEPLQWESHDYQTHVVPLPASLFSLTSAQQDAFLHYYSDPQHVQISPNIRLANYLSNLVSGFSYSGDTYSATEALSNQSGNCLSLAVLTTALAKLVDLDVLYQEVHTAPIYKRFGNLMTTSTHVRSLVLQPKEQQKDNVIIFRSRAVIDYFPSSTNDVGEYLSEQAFISMYYQNMAANALVKDDKDLAYSYLAQAMALDPANAETINTLTVLYRKDGYVNQARALYEYVINNDIESVHTLSNFAVLLKKVGDKETLASIGEMYLNTDDSNPYRWYDIGNEYLDRGDHLRAKVFFKRAVERGPYLSEGYLGLAKVYYLEGNWNKAESMMMKALSLTYPSDNQALYAAKLEAIQNTKRP